MSNLLFIVIVIGFVAFYVIKQIFKYSRELKKDDEELNKKSIYEMFPVLIDGLNEYCYKGNGNIIKIDKRTINLYKDGSCQILTFQYNGGMLTVFWHYKYYQQEMKYEKNITQARNATEEGQLQCLKIIISEFLEEYKNHEAKVDASGKTEEILKQHGLSKENLDNARDFLRN